MTSLVVGLLLGVIGSPSMSLVEQGDREFARLRYPQAMDLYTLALGSSSDSTEVLWRLARVCVCQADVSPEEKKLDLYREAEDFARRCIGLDSLKSEAHTWRAAALGNIATFEGGKTKIRLCYEIKRELDRSIALNGSDDIAYSILGSYYMALGNVSWFERQLAKVFLGSLPDGGYAESEQALKKAIAVAPEVVRHHYELGVLYIREDRTTEAIGELRLAASLPVQIASDARTQDSARGLLTDLAP